MAAGSQFRCRLSQTEMQSIALPGELVGHDACSIALVLGGGLSWGVVASAVERLRFTV